MNEGYLEVDGGDTGAKRVPLAGDQLTLGRARGNDVSFPDDDTASMLHAVLERVDDGWCVRDLGSAQGTFVNGEKLSGERLLRPGDEIVLGRSAVVFRAAGSDAWPGAHAAAVPAGADAGYLDATDEWRGAAAEAPIAPPSPLEHRARPAAAASERARARAAPAARPGPGTAEAPRRRGGARTRGVARHVQIRRSADEQDVLAFRIDRYDGSGNRLTPVAVEFRGFVGGQISDGEEVEATGRWSSGTLRAEKVFNLSTNAEIRGIPKTLRIVHGLAFAFVLGWIGFVVYLIVSH